MLPVIRINEGKGHLYLFFLRTCSSTRAGAGLNHLEGCLIPEIVEKNTPFTICVASMISDSAPVVQRLRGFQIFVA